LSGLATPTYLTATPSSETRVTVLENGIRVASEQKFGQFCTVGVAIDSGSRYEVAFPSGISHYLEKLAFHSTSKFSSKDEILQRLEKFGGICDCQSTRDTFLYAASVDNRGLEQTIEVLGDVVLRPRFSPEEMEFCEMAIRYELEDLDMKPDQEPLLVEQIHAAAFKHNTLGLPKICPEENVGKISRQTLYTYLKAFHRPERMVVAGVGVDHDTLVEAAQRHFVDQRPVWETEETMGVVEVQTDRSIAQYTGGIVSREKDLSDVSLGPTPMPELGHIVIGLESVGHQHPDFIPFCVLNMMMGGGGSFSAGGPGKGMYTRLYTRVLNKYHWMYSATAYNHAYNDSGIFCIHASSHPQSLVELTQVLVRELVAITGRISEEELNRAKTQLKSMLLMNLESRPVIFEDCARQVLAQGHRRKPEHFISQIDMVTRDDLNRIGRQMLDSKAAVAAIGSLKKMPSFNDIEIGLLDKEGALPNKRRFNLFR
jgi:processing peptidase subunit alpha